MYKYKKIVSMFFAKMLKYRIMCKDMFTLLGLDYRDALLICIVLSFPYYQDIKL